MSQDRRIEDLLRELTPQVLGALLRRYRQFDACEDAVQEALLDASLQWRRDGLPESPRGWLITVASRRMTDQLRSEQARRRRELEAVDELAEASSAGEDGRTGADDTLKLLFLCSHPSLSPASQIALTLRAVGGLSTAEIASAFLVPEATMAQRISRAKQRIRTEGLDFGMPAAGERPERLRVVLHVLYLVFNEGYSATSGSSLQRGELTREAIRLCRILHRLLPDDGEIAGLLSLMLLTDARRAARSGYDGSLIPLAEQNRSLWNRAAIAQGEALVSTALAGAELGPYQLQAAIAAVHAEAPSAAETDWRQILGLYDLLGRLAPNPMVTLNHAVAVAMVRGPRAGLDLLTSLEQDERMASHHRLYAVRAHLLEMAGDRASARVCYELAARRTTSLPERRYLESRAGALARAGTAVHRPDPGPPR